MKGRAIRRHQKDLMRIKCMRIYPYLVYPIYADNLAKCSCPGCGNSRKWYNRRTRAEYLAHVSMIEQLCDEGFIDQRRPRKHHN